VTSAVQEDTLLKRARLDYLSKSVRALAYK